MDEDLSSFKDGEEFCLMGLEGGLYPDFLTAVGPKTFPSSSSGPQLTPGLG